MPTRQSAPIGAPCWVDLQTSGTERSREFYGRLFGWEASEPNAEFGGYFNFTSGGVLVAGCMAADAAAPVSDVWSVYLATDDATKTLETAVARGAQVVVPAMPVGDLGTMGFVIDASGAGIGLWQANQFAGFGVFGEAGAPSWFELLTRDYAAAVPFYQDVFRWDAHQVSDTDDFRYTTLREPGSDAWLAGIMDASGFLPEGVPPHWSVYFGCDDADATVASVVDLGGSVVRPAEDTPYGRLATVSDPMGAAFKLVAPNEAMPARS
jgi:predicted enzyme related to lactoylglutathione lyase